MTPTILDFFGFTGSYLDHLSLLRSPVEPYEIFSYFTLAEQQNHQNFMIMRDNLKLIYDRFRHQFEMYDLKSDPAEKQNVYDSPEYHELQQQLLAELDSLMFYMNYGDVEAARRRQAAVKKSAPIR